MDEKKAEHLLDDAGVFWGHEGLRGLAESDEFWNKQTYGTRLYYGDGIADYLHRDVLRAAVRSMDALAARLAEAERDRDSAVALYGEAKVRADETERENASLSAQVAALEAQVAGVYEVRKEIGYLTYELDQGAAKCTANTLARIGGQLDAALSAAPEVVADSITKYVSDQMAWSMQTFGEGPRTEGVLRHIEKEIDEVRSSPDDVMEWADIAILALDGAWRCGASPADVSEAMLNKQRINFSREYPNPQSQDEPSEHVRRKEGE